MSDCQLRAEKWSNMEEWLWVTAAAQHQIELIIIFSKQLLMAFWTPILENLQVLMSECLSLLNLLKG